MASVTIRGRFEEGKKVELYPGGDFFNSIILRGKAVASAKVKGGEATFTGLPAGERYHAVQRVDGEVRHAAVTAKDTPPAKRRESEKAIAEQLRRTLPAHNEGSGVITGPRSTGNATLDDPTAAQRSEAVIEQSAIPAAHAPTDGVPDADHLKQADAPKGAEQRSDTPMGSAEVFDPETEVSPPVVTESVLGREERERLEAEAKKRKRSRRPAKRKPAAKKSPAKARPKATEAQKAARRKKAAGRARARKAKGGR